MGTLTSAAGDHFDDFRRVGRDWRRDGRGASSSGKTRGVHGGIHLD